MGATLGQVGGMGQDVGQRTDRVGQRPVAVAQVVVQFHVTQCRKAVEPGVGHGFHGLGKAVFADAPDKLLALRLHFDRPGLARNDHHVAFGQAGSHFQSARLVRQTQQIGACHDGGDEVFACLRGVRLEFGFVHVFI